jgi:Flp pilus assembly pilin Flp
MLNDPVVEYIKALLGRRLAAVRRDDRGASAIEWAIITGLLAIIALAVFLIIEHKILGAAHKINTGP